MCNIYLRIYMQVNEPVVPGLWMDVNMQTLNIIVVVC